VNPSVPVGNGVLVGVSDGGGVCDPDGEGVLGNVAVRGADCDFVGDLEIVPLGDGMPA
jgi:hypothetical protein